jgi:hypothetical protein
MADAFAWRGHASEHYQCCRCPVRGFGIAGAPTIFLIASPADGITSAFPRQRAAAFERLRMGDRAVRLIGFVANKPRPVAERATRKEREDIACDQRQISMVSSSSIPRR